jgi:hypothetical protein
LLLPIQVENINFQLIKTKGAFMKLLLISIVTLLSLNSFAWNPLLLQKKVASGFVPENMAYNLDCKIFGDKVEIIYTKIGLVKNIEYKNQVQTDIYELINKAGLGKITSGPAPADIGNQEYTAFEVSPNDAFKTIDLGSVLDSRSITKNSSPAARKLTEYLDQVCDSVLKM